MRPGQRVELIKKVAGRMADAPQDVGLTLRQFGLPNERWWDDETAYSYSLRMLEDGADDTLLDLHEYLFPNSSITPPVSTFWTPNAFRLFISHVAAKKAMAASLKAALLPYGIDGFVAHEDHRANARVGN